VVDPDLISDGEASGVIALLANFLECAIRTPGSPEDNPPSVLE